MEAELDILMETPLFAGITPAQMPTLLNCLQAVKQPYKKGAYIYMEGDKANCVGVVLTGQVQVLREDYFGNRTILADLGPGELFAETFVCAGVPAMPVSVQATQNSTVLLLNYSRVLTTCSAACSFHTRLIQNMMAVLAGKALALNRKLGYVGRRTMREKLLAYLADQGAAAHSATFHIPFNRQQLADYLGVDRSALSAELSRMQADGLIRYHKNEFTLLEKAKLRQ